jgi:hypothetical protein
MCGRQLKDTKVGQPVMAGGSCQVSCSSIYYFKHINVEQIPGCKHTCIHTDIHKWTLCSTVIFTVLTKEGMQANEEIRTQLKFPD